MAPTRAVGQFAIFVKRSSGGGLSESGIIALAVVLPVLAIIAVALTTYAYLNGWKLPIFQKLAEVTRSGVQSFSDRRRSRWARQPQRLRSEDDLKSAGETGTERRPGSRPSKYWSAEDISRSKIGSVMSHVPSVRAFATDSEVFKPPPTPSIYTGYAASIFSSKTKVSAFMNADGTPQIVRPSSRKVKTTSKHISMQFLPDVAESVPPLPSPTKTEDSLELRREPALTLKEVLDLNRRSSKELESVALNEKRNAQAIVTDLNWMQYDSGTP